MKVTLNPICSNSECPYCKGTGEIKVINETTSSVSYYDCWGGNRALSCHPKRTECLMSNNQLPADVQLPEELKNKLTEAANAYATAKVGDINTIPAYKINEWEKAADGWEAGAIAYTGKLHQVETYNALLKTEIKQLNAVIEGLKARPGGWVKANEFKYEVGMPYHAKDSRFKGAGHFNSNGAFIWGDCTVTHPKDQDDLYILNEQPAADSKPEPKWVKNALEWAMEAIAFADKEFDCPQPLVETWGNMVMNALHAIQEAQRETEMCGEQWVKATDTVTVKMVNMNEVEKLKQLAISLRLKGDRLVSLLQGVNVEGADEAIMDWLEKKEDKEQVVIHNNSDAFRHWVSDIKGYPFALLGHCTGVWLPPGVTLPQFEKEWEEYEKANNPAKREVKGGGN